MDWRMMTVRAAMIAVACACTISPAAAQSPEQHAVLRQIKAGDPDRLSISEEDGRFLRLMAATSGARRALEVGGAFGYSAIWIGLGLQHTGGHLISIEFDPARAKIAADNIRRTGLSEVV